MIFSSCSFFVNVTWFICYLCIYVMYKYVWKSGIFFKPYCFNREQANEQCIKVDTYFSQINELKCNKRSRAYLFPLAHILRIIVSAIGLLIYFIFFLMLGWSSWKMFLYECFCFLNRLCLDSWMLVCCLNYLCFWLVFMQFMLLDCLSPLKLGAFGIIENHRI